MGMDDFAPFHKRNTCFVVKNIITDSNKTVKIFQYPIPIGYERDLLAIPGVSESDIRASLLKGEILHKLLANEITIVCSDIDLLQFNNDQLNFLASKGVTVGLQITNFNMKVIRREDIQLVGIIDGSNTVFTLPPSDTFFVQNSTYRIIVYLNGVKQLLNDDYFVSESGGSGTGFDTVIMSSPPGQNGFFDQVITADYYVTN